MSPGLSLQSLCVAALLCLSPVAIAQEQPLGGPPVEILNDLAETLGQAHAVRAACNGDSDQTWRNYMMNLLAIEAPSGPRRSSMTSAFNRGYRNQNSRTSSCTSEMPRVEAEIAARGRALAETAANSYLH